MSTARILAVSIACVVISAPAISAQDLSTYREFQLGTSLVTVARQAGVAAEPRVLQQRPALIEELMWQPPPVRGASSQADSVRKVLFTFYNGQLFRMVVSYDRDRTEGLTAEDLVTAISATYGMARLPATQLMPMTRVDSASLAHWKDSRYSHHLNYDDKILANWGDSQNSVHLFRSAYQAGFGIVVFSKSLDVLARAAIVEAARLDELEAPQREIVRLQKQTEDNRVAQANAREVNRTTFRP
jgi:hypothetical protein